MKKLITIILVLLANTAVAATYYVDPDYSGGTKNGQASTPWSSLDAGAWSTINTALASDDVTVYLSAFETDGTTQESQAWFLELKRSDTSSNRLTIDGHGYYNTNDSSPSWSANPTGIGAAYSTGKVFKLTGNGSSALGWSRSSTYPKQDYVTVRGFEVTGSGARTSFAGDYAIFEYLNIHDVTGIGPGLSILYTFPDSCSSVGDRVMDASTDMTVRHFIIDTVYGEGFYIGSINPDCPAQVQCDMGNEHDTILVEDFYIANPGTGGGQGDGIDVKNGVTNLTIRNGEIEAIEGMGAIVLPQTFVDENQNTLVDSVYIHDSQNNGEDVERAIYGVSSTVSCTPSNYKGYNGVTLQNLVIDTHNKGINFGSTGYLENIYIYNSTIYNVTSDALTTDTLDDGVGVIKNVFSFDNTGNEISIASGWSAVDNAYYGTISGTCTSCDSLNESEKNAAVTDDTGGNFTVPSGSVLIDAGSTIAGFSDDFVGITRPQGSAWDIGAYEYVASQLLFNQSGTTNFNQTGTVNFNQ